MNMVEVLTQRCLSFLQGYSGAYYQQRLKEEIEVIAERNLADYFLIVAAITDEAKARGIDVMARGSAVGSLVAFALGITGVDPIKHGLFFERFLHRHRADLPDIDLDLPSDRREELLAWIFSRFGRDRVAMVCTYQTFQRKSAIREGLKAFNMPLREVESFCAKIPAESLTEEEFQAVSRQGSPEFYAVPVEILPQTYQSKMPLIKRLIGIPQHLSVHPGGVVIADDSIDRYAPVEIAPKGVRAIQYDTTSAEKIGLLKIDILGNRCMSQIQETLKLVSSGSVEANCSSSSISGDDPETFAAIRTGKTIGCFQIESPPVRSVIRRMPINQLKDLTAALALVRPGAATSRAKSAFISCARGAMPTDALLARLLPDSYGIPLFEEDIMLVISTVCGISLEQADAMRARILDSPGSAGEQTRLKDSFIKAAQARGMPDPENLWRVIVQFAAYSFNKSHATSYALLAYRAAFLKTHFPLEFSCAVINSYGGAYPLRTILADFQRQGVEAYAPHVNLSDDLCTIVGGALRLGLRSIKNLRRATRDRIYLCRSKEGPFKSIEDFLTRVPVSGKELESLVLSGACDNLEPLLSSSYPYVHRKLLEVVGSKPSFDGAKRMPTMSIAPVDLRNQERLEIYRKLVRIKNEIEFLGMHVSDHPIRILRKEADRYGCVPLSMLGEHMEENVKIAVVVAAGRRTVTRSGQIMQFITLEDETDLVEAVLLPLMYAALNDPLNNPGPFIVSGKVKDKEGELLLIVSSAMPFHCRTDPYGAQATSTVCSSSLAGTDTSA